MELEREFVVGPIEDGWSDEGFLQDVNCFLTLVIPPHKTVSISTALIWKGSLLVLAGVGIILNVLVVVLRIIPARILRCEFPQRRRNFGIILNKFSDIICNAQEGSDLFDRAIFAEFKVNHRSDLLVIGAVPFTTHDPPHIFDLGSCNLRLFG